MIVNTYTEKRKFLRLDYAIPVTVSIVHNNRLYVCQGFSRNVSASGAALEINISSMPCDTSLICTDTIVEINFELPRTDKNITARAFVKWVKIDSVMNKMLIGIAFAGDDTMAPLELYKYARKERKRRSAGKKWFLFSIICAVSLSVWGMHLNIQNTSLRDQIIQTDSMRLAVESNLITLRHEAIQTLGIAKRQHASLLEKFDIIEQTLIGLSNSLQLEHLLSVDESCSMLEMPKQNGTEKKHAEALAQQNLNNLQTRIDEYSATIASLEQRYDLMQRSLQNRLSAKHMMDQQLDELVMLSARRMARPVPSGYGALPRGMWVLNEDQLNHQTRTEELLSFCAERNVNIVFSKVDLDKTDNPDLLRDMLEQAHDNNMQFHAYYSLRANEFSPVERNIKLCKGWLVDIISFNKGNSRDRQFDGVMLEIDNSVDSCETPSSYIQYLTTIAKLVETRDKRNEALRIGVSVKTDHFGHEIDIVFNNTKKPLTHHLLDIVDCLVIQTPLDTNSARFEIKYASDYDKKVLLGQHVAIDESSNDNQLNKMEKNIGSIVESYLNEPAFAGVAIHSYDQYRQCVEAMIPEHIKNQRSPVISLQPPKIDYRSHEH